MVPYAVMPRALRARLALVTALMAVFVTGGCALSSDYTDGDVGSEDAGDSELPPVDSGGPLADATTVGDSSTVPSDADARPPDATADTGPGPWGDYCLGIPEIVSPSFDAAVGASVQVVLDYPECLQALAFYVDSDLYDGSPFKIAAVDFDGSMTLSLPSVGEHKIIVNGWNNTNDAHVSPAFYVYRSH